jgi:hypothetical protein
MKLFGRQIGVDSMTLELGSDGSAGPCYFCGASVVQGSDLAILYVDRLDPKGDPIQAVCHGSCAEQARHL